MFYLLQAVISLSSAPPWWTLLLSSCSRAARCGVRTSTRVRDEEGCARGEGAHARHGRLAVDVDRPRAREETEREGGGWSASAPSRIAAGRPAAAARGREEWDGVG